MTTGGSLPEVGCLQADLVGGGELGQGDEEGRRSHANKGQAVWDEFHPLPCLECIRLEESTEACS